MLDGAAAGWWYSLVIFHHNYHHHCRLCNKPLNLDFDVCKKRTTSSKQAKGGKGCAGNAHLNFLAALAALYLTLVSQWVTATLEFKHKE